MLHRRGCGARSSGAGVTEVRFAVSPRDIRAAIAREHWLPGTCGVDTAAGAATARDLAKPGRGPYTWHCRRPLDAVTRDGRRLRRGREIPDRTSRAGDTELYRSARPGLALPPRAPRAGAFLLSPAVTQRTKCFYITVLLDDGEEAHG